MRRHNDMHNDKSRSRCRQWSAAALLVCLHSTVAIATDISSSPNNLHFSARAYDLDSGQVVYTEEHQYDATGHYNVTYREPNGTTFGSKLADFSISRFAPNIEQHNDRNGELVRITRKNAQTLSATYRENRKHDAVTETITAADNIVIDAGFHPYILEHWDSLIQGRSNRFEYVVPSWRRSVTLAVAAIPCAQSGQACFAIKPANKFMAIFAHAAEVIYDAQSRQLLEFRGTSNIAKRDGEYHRVRIVYEYRPSIAAVANAPAD